MAALAAVYKPAAAEGGAESQPAAAPSLRKSVFQEALQSMAASEGASAEEVEVRYKHAPGKGTTTIDHVPLSDLIALAMQQCLGVLGTLNYQVIYAHKNTPLLRDATSAEGCHLLVHESIMQAHAALVVPDPLLRLRRRWLS